MNKKLRSSARDGQKKKKKEQLQSTCKLLEQKLWAGHFCGGRKGARALSRSLEG